MIKWISTLCDFHVELNFIFDSILWMSQICISLNFEWFFICENILNSNFEWVIFFGVYLTTSWILCLSEICAWVIFVFKWISCLSGLCAWLRACSFVIWEHVFIRVNYMFEWISCLSNISIFRIFYLSVKLYMFKWHICDWMQILIWVNFFVSCFLFYL